MPHYSTSGDRTPDFGRQTSEFKFRIEARRLRSEANVRGPGSDARCARSLICPNKVELFGLALRPLRLFFAASAVKALTSYPSFKTSLPAD